MGGRSFTLTLPMSWARPAQFGSLPVGSAVEGQMDRRMQGTRLRTIGEIDLSERNEPIRTSRSENGSWVTSEHIDGGHVLQP